MAENYKRALYIDIVLVPVRLIFWDHKEMGVNSNWVGYCFIKGLYQN